MQQISSREISVYFITNVQQCFCYHCLLKHTVLYSIHVCLFLQAGEGSVELFKDKDGDVSSYTSPTVSVRIGKFDDGQIVIGEEILEVEPYEVSNDSDEIYLIAKEKDSPGPPPVNPKVPSMFLHYPFQCLLFIP